MNVSPEKRDWKCLSPSNRYRYRYQAPNGRVVAFTDHAMQRAEEREIDCIKLLTKLEGVKLKRYKNKGVVAKIRNGVVVIITVWKVGSWTRGKN